MWLTYLSRSWAIPGRIQEPHDKVRGKALGKRFVGLHHECLWLRLARPVILNLPGAVLQRQQVGVLGALYTGYENLTSRESHEYMIPCLFWYIRPKDGHLRSLLGKTWLTWFSWPGHVARMQTAPDTDTCNFK